MQGLMACEGLPEAGAPVLTASVRGATTTSMSVSTKCVPACQRGPGCILLLSHSQVEWVVEGKDKTVFLYTLQFGCFTQTHAVRAYPTGSRKTGRGEEEPAEE